MTAQPHKTLADQIHDIYKQLPDCGLKTHLAQWFELRGASQFFKKDSVSSDVEQAALKEYPPADLSKVHDATDYSPALRDAFIKGWSQRTQQPATINWLTDDEIDKLSYLAISDPTGFAQGMCAAQSKLKDRVNCVELAGYLVDGRFIDPITMSGKTINENNVVEPVYFLIKTNPNGQQGG